jgi:hypothetical protein
VLESQIPSSKVMESAYSNQISQSAVVSLSFRESALDNADDAFAIDTLFTGTPTQHILEVEHWRE